MLAKAKNILKSSFEKILMKEKLPNSLGNGQLDANVPII